MYVSPAESSSGLVAVRPSRAFKTARPFGFRARLLARSCRSHRGRPGASLEHARSRERPMALRMDRELLRGSTAGDGSPLIVARTRSRHRCARTASTSTIDQLLGDHLLLEHGWRPECRARAPKAPTQSPRRHPDLVVCSDSARLLNHLLRRHLRATRERAVSCAPQRASPVDLPSSARPPLRGKDSSACAGARSPRPAEGSAQPPPPARVSYIA